MLYFCSNRINRFRFYSGVQSYNSFNLFQINNFNTYLYLGSNSTFKATKNKSLLMYNSKILNVFQNSHWDEDLNFVDILLPSTTFFEKRTHTYINALGLLKRVPALFSIFNKNLLNDFDVFKLFIQLFPQFFKIPNKLKTNLEFII